MNLDDSFNKMESAKKTILDQILEDVREKHRQGMKPLMVFDLDSTLFNVKHRTQAILREFGALPQNKNIYPEECQILESIETQDQDWGIKDCLERNSLRSTIGFFFELRDFWAQNFFSNKYLHYDRPYPGSVEFVKTLKDEGCHIQYLTGRDKTRMEQGTLESLKKYMFPLDSSAQNLTMKPSPLYKDVDFKLSYLKKITGHFKKIVFFENEPLIIQGVESVCPEIQLIFMKSVHSKQAPDPQHLPYIEKQFLFQKTSGK